MYINLITKDFIQDSNVVAVSGNGLTYFKNGCWQFLAAGEYKKVSDNVAQTYNGQPTVILKSDELIPVSSTTTRTLRYYTYYFGLNDLTVSNQAFHSVSGYISDKMQVEAGKELKISASFSAPETSSIEISIIDGLIEKPILPLSQDEVIHEKCFFGLPLRFTAKGNIQFYKNLSYLTSSQSAMEAAMAESDSDETIYTSSYTPDESSYAYVPQHNVIQVKVILRVYTPDAQMPQISDIVAVQ